MTLLAFTPVVGDFKANAVRVGDKRCPVVGRVRRVEFGAILVLPLSACNSNDMCLNLAVDGAGAEASGNSLGCDIGGFFKA